jgi:hypothetical protein
MGDLIEIATRGQHSKAVRIDAQVPSVVGHHVAVLIDGQLEESRVERRWPRTKPSQNETVLFVQEPRPTEHGLPWRARQDSNLRPSD